VSEPAPAVTYLFSDIEGSTRLWESEPERMRPALARHDAIASAAVLRNRGTIVKMTGDGVHAAFESPLDALVSVLELQQELAAAHTAGGIVLKVRCGLHSGADERRRGDFFGPAVNRAARIMSAAHGGQILLSQAVAEGVCESLPAGVTLRDLGAVRLRDLSTPERVYQVLHPQLRAEFPALRSLEATPNNLAQQLNSFIGRERELQEVRALLGGNRLVTLLGMGGLGKSRLSVQLAAEVMDDYPDGVWMVELAPLSDPQLVAQAVASVLAVKEDAGRPMLEALIRFVRDRQLLIVLDNCEHVIDAAALKYTRYRNLTRQLRGEPPGPEGSILKLFGSELGVRIADFAGELLGPRVLVNQPTADVPDAPRWYNRVVSARQYTIAGGTSEIQRNIIGERVLGLPKD